MYEVLAFSQKLGGSLYAFASPVFLRPKIFDTATFSGNTNSKDHDWRPFSFETAS